MVLWALVEAWVSMEGQLPGRSSVDPVLPVHVRAHAVPYSMVAALWPRPTCQVGESHAPRVQLPHQQPEHVHVGGAAEALPAVHLGRQEGQQRGAVALQELADQLRAARRAHHRHTCGTSEGRGTNQRGRCSQRPASLLEIHEGATRGWCHEGLVKTAVGRGRGGGAMQAASTHLLKPTEDIINGILDTPIGHWQAGA